MLRRIMLGLMLKGYSKIIIFIQNDLSGRSGKTVRKYRTHFCVNTMILVEILDLVDSENSSDLDAWISESILLLYQWV